MAEGLDTSTASEFFEEILLCARYGELNDLKQYFSPLPTELVATILQQQDSRGNTALHFCAANGHSNVASLLLSLQSIGIDLQNEGGNTALHWACLNGHLETVKILIDYRADVKIKNKGGRMPIDEAESQGKESIVLWLLALDMRREKEAGVHVTDDADGEGDEADVNVNMTAGQLQDHESSSLEAHETETDRPTNGIKSLDEMDMLD